MSPRIRIMHIITRLCMGGAAKHVILLAAKTDAERFETRLITGVVQPHELDMSEEAREEGVYLTVVRSLQQPIHPIKDLIALKQLRQVIREWRPHVVHTHTSKAGTLGRLAARMEGVPVIIHTFHGHVFHGHFGRGASYLFLQIERALARTTDRLISVDERLRKELIQTYRVAPADKIVSVPLGIDLSAFAESEQHRGQLRQEIGMGPEVPLIGIVARLTPIKGHRYFLEAAHQIARSHPEARFLLVGDGELREALEAQVQELNLENHVLFLGWRQDMPRVYADLDVVVLSSLNEGLPVSLIEAMAAKKPVVATDVGSVSDLVLPGQTGILVPPRDPSKLAQAVQELIENPSRAKELSQRAQEHVWSKYHIDALLERTGTIYCQLLERKGIL